MNKTFFQATYFEIIDGTSLYPLDPDTIEILEDGSCRQVIGGEVYAVYEPEEILHARLTLIDDTGIKEKTLSNTDINGTRKNVPDVVVYGEGDVFGLWVKASSQNEGWMKTSKVANIPGGCVIQTETQQRNPDGSYVLSQALAYVPGVWLDKTMDPPQMVQINIRARQEDFKESLPEAKPTRQEIVSIIFEEFRQKSGNLMVLERAEDAVAAIGDQWPTLFREEA